MDDSREASLKAFSDVFSKIFANYWYVGVLSAVISAIAAAMGDILIRYSFLHEESLPEDQKRIIFMRPFWLAGMTLAIILNPLITLLAYSFAAASVVMPFAGLQIILSLVFAKYILKERIRLIDIIGFIIIAIGITSVLIFGAKHTEISTKDFEVTISYICYNSIVGGLLALLILCSLPVPPMSRWSKLQRLSIACVAGIAGAACNVAAKGGVLLIEIAISGDWIQYFNPYLAGNILVCASMACIQMFFLNWGLLKYPATFIIPVVNSVLISVGSVGAIIVYQETPSSTIGFTCSVIAVIIGIVMLSSSSSDRVHCSIKGVRKTNSIKYIGDISECSTFVPGSSSSIERENIGITSEDEQREKLISTV